MDEDSVSPDKVPWNKGKIVGQKAPLKLKDIWAIRIRLQLGHSTRELALFALGLGLSAFQTPETYYHTMFWPQVIRGVGIMFCLLPPTRLALGGMDLSRVPDASGMFNLMRNLGGAIGLAFIDMVIYSRTSLHANEIVSKLTAGDVSTARFVGIPLDLFALQKA